MADQVTTTDQDPGNDNNLGWRAGLPDEFKEHDWAKAHGKVGDFFKDALNVKTEHDSLKTKLETAIFKPGEDAKDEDWATFHKQLGRPENKDGYEFGELEWPEGIEDWLKESSEHELAEFKDIFLEAGLSINQAQKIVNKFFENAISRWNENQTEIQNRQDKAVEDLKSLWKDDFKANIELAKRGAERIGDFAGIKDDFMKFMEDSRLGDNPLFLRVFHALGKAISEDSALFNQTTPSDDNNNTGPDGRPRLDFPSMRK